MAARISASNTRMQFRVRKRCIVCRSPRYSVVWTDRFSSRQIMAWLRRYDYAADLRAALGEQPFALVQCDDCGARFHRVVLHDDCLPILYGSWIDVDQIERMTARCGKADAYETGVRNLKLALRLRHLVAGQFSAPLRLLDFGCGDGGSILAAQVLGFEAHGVDISESRTTQMRARGLAVHGDLSEFDAVGGDAHAVVLNQVLEHVMDPLGLLENLASRTPLGAVLMVSVPDCRGITRPRDFESFRKVQPLEHVNAFTPASLRAIGRAAGFSLVRRSPSFVATRISDAFRSAGGLVWQPPTTDLFFRLRARATAETGTARTRDPRPLWLNPPLS